MKLEEAIRIMDLFVKNIAVENVKVFELKDACKVALQQLERLQKENEELKEIDLTTVHIKGVCDEKERWRNKIREMLEDYKKGVDCTYCNNTCSRYILCTNLQDLLKEE